MHNTFEYANSITMVRIKVSIHPDCSYACEIGEIKSFVLMKVFQSAEGIFLYCKQFGIMYNIII